MTDLDRIKLAEAMGLKDSFGQPVDRNGAFFPGTDANDCESLIKHLNLQRWDIDIWHSGNAHTHRSNVPCRVRFRFADGSRSYDWDGDDWKQGVCELALKILCPTESEALVSENQNED